MMQRDERTLLRQWITHYATLFGLSNLTVMDNGSTDETVLSTLKRAQARGMNVIWGNDTPHDFHFKGGHFKHIIRSIWDREGGYDFALPVDCDELLGVFTDDGVSIDRADIHAQLNALIGVTRRALRMEMSLFNVPGQPGWFAIDRSFHKGFLVADTIETIDNGQHQPVSRHEPGFHATRLTYLHWHNRPLDELRHHSRMKLDPSLRDLSDEQLREREGTPGVPGAHLIRNLFLREEDYRRQYDEKLQLFVPGLWPGVTRLRKSAQESVWDAGAYLSRNPDVSAFAHGPLYHYVWRGWDEGRNLR
ncbi:glycosyltransferase family 2 protein [Rhizosaccharibacter radicis]|uniref:Glycosyltransferase family 2 protein n=1 Tax=Rhizosaccharibacter radicis TaxID=2782605 RepID=A0ABT1W1R1_9PROT|nr:glycosyltransferase family 2 protein [Acetobacteraceae bacterium KSS12]